ncbi:MAG: PilZ domain-containing protein [Deltaproteobacteria bacterium]|nr:PilZ domain-containing protein [Deltaproteobacteria bacterium]MBW2536544.1 PilZ domain-containing protein [Deltaproteobacteria bacterium]
MTELRPRARRSLRRAVDLPCQLVSKFVDEPLLYWATDLSPEGVWIETPIPMRTGEVVVLCFQPAIWWPGRELRVFAEVARVNTVRRRRGASVAGMGLEFLDLSVHEQRALGAWLRGRPPPLPKRRPLPKSSRRALPAPGWFVN